MHLEGNDMSNTAHPLGNWKVYLVAGIIMTAYAASHTLVYVALRMEHDDVSWWDSALDLSYYNDGWSGYAQMHVYMFFILAMTLSIPVGIIMLALAMRSEVRENKAEECATASAPID